MRTVSAVWEERNLGVRTVECTVEAGDDPTTVLEQLSTLDGQYLVIKVPSGQMDIMLALQAAGFSFVEASISVVHTLRQPQVPRILQRIADETEREEVDPHDLDRVTGQLHQGLFDTDRVFLDPDFRPEQAATRYANWIRDEVERGASVYEPVHRGEPFGFYLFRVAPGGIGVSALSGLYDKVNSPGMGLVLLYLILQEASRAGVARIESRISANNPAVVRTHSALGFDFAGIEYVYICHRGGQS